MPQPVTDNSVPPTVRDFLKHCGVRKRLIAQSTSETRLYHDLGLYGDVAEASMEALEERYSVDMSQFRFERYFPPEFIGNSNFRSLIYSAIPLLGHLHRRRNRSNYKPLNLAVVDEVIKAKRWLETAEEG